MSKILLVDDDALLVRMYQKKLENDGYTVATAGDGEEAMEKIGEFGPDLVLLDIMMPKMNGLQVLKKMKNDKDKTPVVILTNVGANDEDVEKGLELGAVSYLVKAGTRPKAVVSKIKEVLGGYKREIPTVKE